MDTSDGKTKMKTMETKADPQSEHRMERLIGKAELLRIVPFTIQHIYRLEKKGQFVRRVRIGQNRVAWVHSEVLAWMEARMKARDET